MGGVSSTDAAEDAEEETQATIAEIPKDAPAGSKFAAAPVQALPPVQLPSGLDLEKRAREDFARFWEQYVPGGSRTSTVSRPLMREVLLRAVRQLSLSPSRGAWAEELVASALSTAPPALAAEDAFGIFRSVMLNLSSSFGGQIRHDDQFRQALHRDFASPPVQPQPSVISYAKLPKGARLADSAAPRADAMQNRFQYLEANGRRDEPTSPADEHSSRSAQESFLAGLRAALGASQAAYERLVAQAESLRESLVLGRQRGDDWVQPRTLANDMVGGLSSASASEGRWSDQSQAGKLEAEVDRLLDRMRAQAKVIDQQEREMAALHEDCMGTAQRTQNALRRRNELREKLDNGQQDNQELSRQAKAEQLRANLLREAFEQEQNRVGVSLGQAEAYVSDLVAATEGTRRIEVEEQSVARECITALNEVHAAQAREELASEAKLAQLMRELQAAKVALSEAEAPPAAPKKNAEDAANAAVQEKTREAMTELAKVRRRSHGIAAIKRRYNADAVVYRRELQALQKRLDAVHQELEASHTKDGSSLAGARRSTSFVSSTGNEKARLHLEEAAEAALQVAEARLRGELAEAQLGTLIPSSFGEELAADTRRMEERFVQEADRCEKRFEKELEHVRSELSASMRSTPSGASPRKSTDDLAAAGLQRRVGSALAAEREKRCRFEEERLQKVLAEEELKNLRVRLSSSFSRQAAVAAAGSSRSGDGANGSYVLKQQPADGELDKQRPQLASRTAEPSSVSEAPARHAPPTAAAGDLQARLAALRGQLTGSSSRLRNSSPREEGSRSAANASGDQDRRSQDLRSLQTQLQALREQLNAKD
eukprot:TRINITY_DN31388_c0_g2_i1.p1 TRINITY_DN31388_c0_g2~~TRINITY_DN31388_c0_g2_i1.p1  ORF type:complete len:865 (-),score=190.42 TRINITY_DN31388_c0_g2_i1:140-2629(-)